MFTTSTTEQSMSKRTKAEINHAVADSIMTTFVETIRARQERQGCTHEGSGLFALGYLQSMLATFMVQHPQVMADVAERLVTVNKDMAKDILGKDTL